MGRSGETVSPSGSPSRPSTSVPPRQWFKVVATVLAVAGALVAFRALGGPRLLLSLVEQVRGAGFLGVLAFAALFVVAALLLLPASVLTLGAGFAWGPALGLAVVLPSAVLAATAAFALSRSLARGWVERRVGRSARFKAIDEAVGRGGLKLVVLLRLSPLVPFNLLNPTLGLTRVALREYVVGSAVGMAPGALLYLYLGSLVTSASELLSGERPQAGAAGTTLYVLGLVATVAVTVWVTRAARVELARTLAPEVPPVTVSGERRTER